MSTTPTIDDRDSRGVRFEPDERPPPILSAGLALQFAIPHVVWLVVVPAVVVRAAGGAEAFLSWATFAALAVCGAVTALQAARVGRVGSGYLLITGASNASIAVCVPALATGGPALLATLVAVSALVQFAIAARLSLLRRIFTPTVSGTVIMLVPVAVLPMLFGLATEAPEGAARLAAPAAAGVTLVVTGAGVLFSRGVWRLWVPAVGIAAGLAVGAAVGIYDTSGVADAGWVGLPAAAWPGFDPGFGQAFWILLPGFLFVALAEAVKTVGDGIAIQLVSRRTQRAVDFRAVQGAIAANGVGSVLAGIAATVPCVPYSTVIGMVRITGVAARSVGVAVGCGFVALAFLPKFMALVVAMPPPVVGAHLAVFMVTLFSIGLRVVVNDRVTHRKGVVAGVAFCVGVCSEYQLVFPDGLGAAWSGLLGNGIVTGGLAAMLMAMLLELFRSRPRRIRTTLSVDSHAKIDAFLAEFSAGRGWSGDMADRVRAAGEEALLTLIGREGDGVGQRERDGPGETPEPKRLVLAVRGAGDAVELEFVVSTDAPNIEDRVALLGNHAALRTIEGEVSLRLLRHLASSVRHQQYHDTDVLTVRVEQASS